VYQLYVNSRGVLFTCYTGQNPPLRNIHQCYCGCYDIHNNIVIVCQDGYGFYGSHELLDHGVSLIESHISDIEVSWAILSKVARLAVLIADGRSHLELWVQSIGVGGPDGSMHKEQALLLESQQLTKE
jgi:hypothetical protein